MSRLQDGHKTSIDEAVKTVITDATASAVRKSTAELMKNLDSATAGAKDAVKALEAATKSAHKAVASGERAIQKLRHTVWAIASTLFIWAVADLLASDLLQWFGSAPTSVPLEDEAVRAIGRLVGILPLAGLALVRGTRLTKQKVRARRSPGTRDGGSPES